MKFEKISAAHHSVRRQSISTRTTKISSDVGSKIEYEKTGKLLFRKLKSVVRAECLSDSSFLSRGSDVSCADKLCMPDELLSDELRWMKSILLL